MEKKSDDASKHNPEDQSNALEAACLPPFRNDLAVKAQLPEKNIKIGSVVSTKMAKTIVVEVSRRVPHPLYKRITSKRKKFYAHDEHEVAQTGDVVRIVETRPLSRLKRWRLEEVLKKDSGAPDPRRLFEST